MREYDIVVIGAGPAGLAAAISAKNEGIDDILMIERDHEPGGILNQCIHNGFGLHTFKEELTGPEYAARFVEEAGELGIPVMLNTMAADISPLSDDEDMRRDPDAAKEDEVRNGVKAQKTAPLADGDPFDMPSRGYVVTTISKTEGLLQINTKAVILAMGCRERPRGALNIPGYRPAGIYSAGTAQRLINIEGYMPGKEVVILGSGDIGLIMARRMTLEGAKVKLVAELMPYSGGLKRNIVQCLDDLGIPLLLSHTVVHIDGKDRVKGVTIAKVDDAQRPISGSEEYVSCDTLLLSVGLLPENELTKGAGAKMHPVTGGPVVDESLQTSLPGVFACGNVLHVHDLVDYVCEEAAAAGRHAADYVKNTRFRAEGRRGEAGRIKLLGKGGVRYTVPSSVDTDRMDESLTVRFRVGNVYKNAYLCTYYDGELISRRRRPVMAPGEMEQIVLKKKDLKERKGLGEITIAVEEQDGQTL